MPSYEYYLENKAHILESNKRYEERLLAQDPTYFKRAQRRFFSNHPDYNKLKCSEFRKKNPAALHAADKKYRLSFKGKIAKKRWRATRRLFEVNQKYSISPKKVLHLFLKSKGVCFYCGIKITESNFTIDHRIPLVRGGTNHGNNLVIACHHCNSSKREKTVKEYNLFKAKKT